MTDWHSSAKSLRSTIERHEASNRARMRDALHNPSKAELREMLAEAVRNTASPSKEESR
jgi:hypothetical protein